MNAPAAGHRLPRTCHRNVRAIACATTVVFALALAGCSNAATLSDTTTTKKSTTTIRPTASGTIVVSVAASLTESFTVLKDDFERSNPAAHITLNFGSSTALSAQIRDGAPADLAAFADVTPMSALDDAGLLADAPKIFAKNQLTIVTKVGNPTGIASIADLPNAGIISLCVSTAPCGKFADKILTTAKVKINESQVSRGTDVKTTLAAVTEGDAVAAIVYVTDAVAAAGRVDAVEIPARDNVIASYPIATLKTSRTTGLARAFEAYVLSDGGQAVLRKAGFLAP